jgi:hypothetical protein
MVADPQVQAEEEGNHPAMQTGGEGAAGSHVVRSCRQAAQLLEDRRKQLSLDQFCAVLLRGL